MPFDLQPPGAAEQTTMANRPRRHHYVPSFYLAGFTVAGSDKDRLHVFDQSQIKAWPSTPKNAGHARDFYAVDLGPNVAASSFESDVLARLETEFSRVVRTAVESESLPEGSAFDVLLNFVATMATRTPRIRGLVARVTDLLMKSALQELVATVDGWQQFCNYCRDAGIDHSDAEAERMRQFVLSSEYEINLDQTSHVHQMIKLVDAVLPALARRHWSLGIAAPGAPDFVCSDAPVSLAPTDRFDMKEDLHLAAAHTILGMPLTRRAVLIGSYEARTPILRINEFGVLSMNALTITEGKHIFSAHEDFAYLGSDKHPKRRSDLEQSLRRRGAKYTHLEEAIARWFRSRTESTFSNRPDSG